MSRYELRTKDMHLSATTDVRTAVDSWLADGGVVYDRHDKVWLLPTKENAA